MRPDKFSGEVYLDWREQVRIQDHVKDRALPHFVKGLGQVEAHYGHWLLPFLCELCQFLQCEYGFGWLSGPPETILILSDCSVQGRRSKDQ